MIYRCALRIQATIDSSVSALKLTDEVHKGPQKSDVQYLSFMSFNSTDTFSFDEPTTPELPGSLSDETIWVASLDDQALLGDSPRSAGSLELPPRPTQLLDLDASSTLVDTFNGRTTLATGDCEVQQHTPPIDSSANSNTVALVVEMVSSWFVGRGNNPFFVVANPSGAHAVVCL